MSKITTQYHTDINKLLTLKSCMNVLDKTVQGQCATTCTSLIHYIIGYRGFWIEKRSLLIQLLRMNFFLYIYKN